MCLDYVHRVGILISYEQFLVYDVDTQNQQCTVKLPTSIIRPPSLFDIRYSNALIDIRLPEPFFQFPNTLRGFYNQETNTTLCILLVNVTKYFIITMLISGTMFYCAIIHSSVS